MELFLDTANVEDIKALNEMLRIDGVTTNPTILTKANKDYMQSIKEIMEILNEDQKLFVEVLANTTEDILKEARYINGLRKNTYANHALCVGHEDLDLCQEYVTYEDFEINTFLTKINETVCIIISDINTLITMATITYTKRLILE